MKQEPGQRAQAAVSTRERTVGVREEALLASIVDSSDDAIVSETLDGVITSWNRAAERMYGYRSEEITGKPFSLLLHPDRGDEMVTILKKIQDGQRVDHCETVRLKKDGSAFSISLTVSPILDASGTIIGVSSIARDITEHRRLEEQARTAAQYARSLIEASPEQSRCRQRSSG